MEKEEQAQHKASIRQGISMWINEINIEKSTNSGSLKILPNWQEFRIRKNDKKFKFQNLKTQMCLELKLWLAYSCNTLSSLFLYFCVFGTDILLISTKHT